MMVVSRVFVCYAQENDEHKAAVHDLAVLVRDQGNNVTFDQWAEGERRDWDLWARQGILNADFVLVIVSETVQRLADGLMPSGFRGLRTELDLLRELYNAQPDVWRKRILPVVFPDRSVTDIPTFLQPHNADHYVLTDFTATGAASLLRTLTGWAAAPRPEPRRARVGRHWVVSARGTDISADEFWFTGRDRALAGISDFAQVRRAGLLVVTGMPGAGKSAVLGVSVLRSLAPDLLPAKIRASTPDCSITAAVHARNKDADVVLAEIASQLVGGTRSSDDVRELLDEVIDPNCRPVCVIDAIDEANDPAGVADAIRWLSGRAVIIVGVRSIASADADSAALLPAALQVRHPVVIDLDASEHASARDVAIYVACRLRADTGRPGGYGTAAWDMDVLATVIGAEIHDEVAAGNFLVAQFVVEEMLAMPVLADRRRGWSDALHWPKHLGEWVERDVHRRLGDADALQARATLTPVAHALRGGLAVDLWRALLPSFGLTVNPDSAIASVTKALGFYLTSPATGSYAMRHEQFAGYFANVLLPGRSDVVFVEVLLDRVPRRDDRRLDWARADEYTALNLLAHAHRAGAIDMVIAHHPACLARVDRLSATTLLSAAVEPACEAAADVLRRAAYESSIDYGQRAAALQVHAALAGHDDLAAVLLSQAEEQMPWSVTWSAGVPDASPVAIGAAIRGQAVVPVAGYGDADDPPSVVLTRANGSCSLRDAASGHELAPDVFIELFDDQPPLLRAWRTPSGLVRLAVGRHDGWVDVWALTGRSAGSVIWRCRVEPEVGDLARVPGPRGTDLIVTLAGGTLTVHPLRPFEPSAAEPLLRTACQASRVLPLEPADAAAFLTAGNDTDLTAWRIAAGSGTFDSSVHQGLRTDTILAGGDGNLACVLWNTEHAVDVTWLTAGLSSAGPLQRLDDGGRTTRVALAVHLGTATAAVADGSGGIRVFDLRPDAPAIQVSRYDTDHAVYDLAFVDQRAMTLAVGAWSGFITVLGVRDRSRSSVLRMRHGESAVSVLPLGETNQSMLVATRSITGLTRIWSVVSSPGSVDPPATSLSAVETPGNRLLLVAASAGQPRFRCWSIDPVERRTAQLPDLIHPGGVQAVAAARVAGRIWLATAGETGTTLWAVTEGRDVHIEATYLADQPDLEHVVLGADSRIVLGTAGPEHLRLWTLDGEQLVDVEDEPVTAVVHEQVGGRLLIAAGNDDGDVRLIDTAVPAIRTVYEGNSVVAVALLIADGAIVVSADRYGGLVAAPARLIETVPWQISHLVTASNTRDRRLFGVADSPPRLLSWVVDDDGSLRLDRSLLGELRGVPLHVARTESAVAVADAGGQLLIVDAAGAWVTAVNLNVTVDALTGVPGSNTFVAARGGRLICVARSGR
jgi:hypothetical protein